MKAADLTGSGLCSLSHNSHPIVRIQIDVVMSWGTQIIFFFLTLRCFELLSLRLLTKWSIVVYGCVFDTCLSCFENGVTHFCVAISTSASSFKLPIISNSRWFWFPFHAWSFRQMEFISLFKPLPVMKTLASMQTGMQTLFKLVTQSVLPHEASRGLLLLLAYFSALKRAPKPREARKT